jgi:hypothetical protein
MWVAVGVAAEKSSRVMELMISVALFCQMLTGKVVGIGAAGLTQYLAIVLPALVVLVFQNRIAEAILGPDWASGAPIVGLTPVLLLGYGVFFLLGFTLFALIYAAMGSFVSRPDDLQTLSLPLSLLAVLGYLSAIGALSRWERDVDADRFVSAAVQSVRDARSADGRGGQAMGSGAVSRAVGAGDRRRSRRSVADVRRRGPVVRDEARVAGVHRGRETRGVAVAPGLGGRVVGPGAGRARRGQGRGQGRARARPVAGHQRGRWF